ncbi:response regulator [Amycolatopsis oliviviridis]|uniref:response regulator n=1 Tax=Amycolatopsis oliviviridis TaxID=1471590 RepID=UPI001747EB13|nr:response regulator transcription factor [Amycolatopsis oliviviridis]
MVADADELARAGICSILRASGTVDVVADTESGRRAVELARRYRPDVLITDMPTTEWDGIETTRRLNRELPTTKVVILTSVATEDDIYRSFDSGASGFLKKEFSSRKLIDAVSAVASGSAFLSPAITRCVIDSFLRVDRGRTRAAREQIDRLTAREREVLAHLVHGLGNAEIARLLFVSEGAVKGHVSHILTKLGCANRVQAAIIAHDSAAFPAPVARDVLVPVRMPVAS